jgi:hypothetical protein
VNDCLSDIEITPIIYKNVDALLQEQPCKNIVVFSSYTKINKVLNVVKYLKPEIIFYLSDEKGNNSRMVQLEKYTKAIFRSYNHKHYCYNLEKNFHLPLGYVWKPNTVLKKISERNYNASFVGEKKSDRHRMATAFETKMLKTNIQFVEHNWQLDDLPNSPQECFEIYNDSIFVLSGRGNVSLNCFRIYEAIVAGAIPVLVGDLKEIETTFCFHGKIPPFVFDESWEKAVEQCNDLLKNVTLLQEIQNNLVDWWNSEISTIKQQIKQAIQSIN